MADVIANVVWADGTHDNTRECLLCESHTCVNIVHREQYKIVSDKLSRQWDKDNPVI